MATSPTKPGQVDARTLRARDAGPSSDLGANRGRDPGSRLVPDSEGELRDAIAQRPKVSATIWSEHRPKREPVPHLEALQEGKRLGMKDAKFDASYYVAITCWRLAVPVSMSDAGHYDQSAPEAELAFGDPVDDDEPAAAVGNHPSTPGSFHVPGIGVARSWISITFGNYVFPSNAAIDESWSPKDGMVLAAPELVALAQRHFACAFRQTFAWG